MDEDVEIKNEPQQQLTALKVEEVVHPVTTIISDHQNNSSPIILQNIPISTSEEVDDIPFIYTEYITDNSDGHLHIDDVQEGGVIETYIIEHYEEDPDEEDDPNEVGPMDELRPLTQDQDEDEDLELEEGEGGEEDDEEQQQGQGVIVEVQQRSYDVSGAVADPVGLQDHELDHADYVVEDDLCQFDANSDNEEGQRELEEEEEEGNFEETGLDLVVDSGNEASQEVPDSSANEGTSNSYELTLIHEDDVDSNDARGGHVIDAKTIRGELVLNLATPDDNGDQEEQPTDEEDEEMAHEGEPGGGEVEGHEGSTVEDETQEGEDYHDDDDDDAMEEDVDDDFKDVLECDICRRAFKTAAGLKRHITVNHAEEEDRKDPLTFQLCPCCLEPMDSAHTIGEIKCAMCDKLFTQEIILQRHCSIDHCNTDNKFKCVECDKKYDKREQLVDHLRAHPLNKNFKCVDCNREFTRKYHLERHVAQTGCNGAPKKIFTCKVCKKIFHRKDNLADHLRAHLGQGKRKKIFTCEFCAKEFQGSALLNIHVRTHTGERPYQCDLCPKSFPSSGAMKKHRRKHTGERPYMCKVCNNRFAAKETLNRHMRIHTGDKPHGCHFCGKSFIQASQLRAHIFHHTGENAYTCPHCNRAFNRKLRLTTHIKYVHEGAQPLVCTECKKTFFRKEDVQRHMLSHTGERPYSCEECHKTFAVKSSLRLHQLTHRKEPPCSCETCGRAFIRQDCLMRHMRARHRDVLEDIMASAEKKRLQQQLLNAATEAAARNEGSLIENVVWNELTLTESIKELLTILMDESCLKDFGFPDAPIDKILDCVIKRCGHKPASEDDFDYIGRMRENAKLLFTVVIDDEAVKSLLNNQTVDEVILHVLRLAKQDNPGSAASTSATNIAESVGVGANGST